MTVAEPTNPSMPGEIHGETEVSDASIPLDVAGLCPDAECNRIYDSRRGACPSCMAPQSIPLATVLNRRVLPFRTNRDAGRN